MVSVASLDGRLGYALGLTGFAAGLVVATPQTAVLVALVAFFVGKSMNSTLRMVAA
jgi:hypothetical protein